MVAVTAAPAPFGRGAEDRSSSIAGPATWSGTAISRERGEAALKDRSRCETAVSPLLSGTDGDSAAPRSRLTDGTRERCAFTASAAGFEMDPGPGSASGDWAACAEGDALSH